MNAQGVEKAIERYLQKGGKIHQIKAHDDRFASHRTRWHFGGINNFRKQYLKKSPVATAPGGRIEPGRPRKPWPNLRKTSVTPTLAGMSAADQFNAAVARIMGR